MNIDIIDIINNINNIKIKLVYSYIYIRKHNHEIENTYTYTHILIMSILSAFNNHMIEFLEDVESIFPEDRDIKKGKSAIEMMKKANPRMLILIWKTNVAIPYGNHIENGDLDYFLQKDYKQDFQGTDSEKKILDAIDRFRQPIRNMGSVNKEKAMKYIQNLTKLSLMYNS